MAITVADFKAAFPDVSTDDVAITAALAEAQDIFSATERGVFMLTAHLLTIIKDGFDQEATVERAGEQWVTLVSQAESGDESFYTSTTYGRRFLKHRKARIGGLARAI